MNKRQENAKCLDMECLDRNFSGPSPPTKRGYRKKLLKEDLKLHYRRFRMHLRTAFSFTDASDTSEETEQQLTSQTHRRYFAICRL